jgi:gamma-glutamylcyclotransferase (GGCT)/AIG2-like uncharacterized protein YtfP
MYEYISRYFSFVGNAKVKGKLFDVGTYPAGIPTHEASYIIGELYQIKDPHEFSWAIGQLDDYEGMAVESDEVQFYRRDITEVYINNQVTYSWIYWYNVDVSGKELISSGDMLEYLHSKSI